MKYGIDVSMFVDVDIHKYMPDFVMIRGGEGCEYKDKKAYHYASVCQTNNIPYGIYWVLDFSTGNSKEHAHECLNFISQLPGRPKMGIWADCETPLSYNNVAIYEFCQLIQDAGYYAGIYTGINQLRNGTVVCDAFDKWAAYYGSDSGSIDDFSDEEKIIMANYCTIWQYHGGSGTQPDLDVCFLDDLEVFDLKAASSVQPGSGAPPCVPDALPVEEVSKCLELADLLIENLKLIKSKLEDAK